MKFQTSLSRVTIRSYLFKFNDFYKSCNHLRLRCCSTRPNLDNTPDVTANSPPVSRQSLKTILNTNSAGDFVKIQGWVRGLRQQKLFVFLEVTDGSTFHKLPVVAPTKTTPKELSMHCAVEITGELAINPKNAAVLELRPSQPIKILNECDQRIYPLGGKIHYEDEHIRQYLHLRSKTNKYSSLFRLRSAATKAVNDYFFQNDFIQIHTPLLTSNDCEGAGEVFLARPANENLMLEKPNVRLSNRPTSAREIRTIQTHDHADLPFDGQKHLHAHQCNVCNAVFSHTHTKKPAHVSKSYDNHYCEEHKHLRKETPKDYNPDEAFFNRKAYLTVSSQLHLEAMASGLEKVWTFSPVFRSENTQSTRHLSEFYMVEAEIGFAYKMEQILDPMESLVKSVVHDILYGNNAEWNFYSEMTANKELRKILDNILKNPFTVMTYKEASHLLQTKANSVVSPSQGISREQELLLVEKLNNNIPVFVIDWPKELKPFYMRQSLDDPSTVSAVDLLVPGVGELCGGSLREDNLDKLLERTASIDPSGQLEKSLGWYFDLRRFGGNPTGGFGMGFDRLLQLVLGVKNIRDVVPFPRWPHNCSM